MLGAKHICVIDFIDFVTHITCVISFVRSTHCNTLQLEHTLQHILQRMCWSSSRHTMHVWHILYVSMQFAAQCVDRVRDTHYMCDWYTAASCSAHCNTYCNATHHQCVDRFGDTQSMCDTQYMCEYNSLLSASIEFPTHISFVIDTLQHTATHTAIHTATHTPTQHIISALIEFATRITCVHIKVVTRIYMSDRVRDAHDVLIQVATVVQSNALCHGDNAVCCLQRVAVCCVAVHVAVYHGDISRVSTVCCSIVCHQCSVCCRVCCVVLQCVTVTFPAFLRGLAVCCVAVCVTVCCRV